MADETNYDSIIGADAEKTGFGIDAAKVGIPIIGAAIGVAQIIGGNKALKRARKLIPPKVDAQERGYLGELDALRKGYGTGAAYKEAIRQLNLNSANAAEQALDASGGYGGAALDTLSTINENQGNAYGKIFSQADQTRLAYEQMYGLTLDKMVKRRSDIDIMKYAQELNEGMRRRSAGEQNLVNAGDETLTALAGLV